MMIEIFFGAVLLILAAAVVLLFAMLGELNSRLPTEREAAVDRDATIAPLEDALLGAEPGSWPQPLEDRLAGDAGAGDPAIALVLSTACTTCKDVATQVAEELDGGGAGDLAVIVSTADRERGEEFVRRYGLERVAHYIDEGGTWVSEAFNVRMSPTALVMRGGRLESALVFQDVQALRAMVTNPKGVS
jgi:hypothetical protein